MTDQLADLRLAVALLPAAEATEITRTGATALAGGRAGLLLAAERWSQAAHGCAQLAHAAWRRGDDEARRGAEARRDAYRDAARWAVARGRP